MSMEVQEALVKTGASLPLLLDQAIASYHS